MQKFEADAKLLLQLLIEKLHLQAADMIYLNDFAHMWVTSEGEAIELDAAMERCHMNGWLSEAPGGYQITPLGVQAASRH